jgi:hypothetical protein
LRIAFSLIIIERTEYVRVQLSNKVQDLRLNVVHLRPVQKFDAAILCDALLELLESGSTSAL